MTAMMTFFNCTLMSLSLHFHHPCQPLMSYARSNHHHPGGFHPVYLLQPSLHPFNRKGSLLQRRMSLMISALLGHPLARSQGTYDLQAHFLMTPTLSTFTTPSPCPLTLHLTSPHPVSLRMETLLWKSTKTITPVLSSQLSKTTQICFS